MSADEVVRVEAQFDDETKAGVESAEGNVGKLVRSYTDMSHIIQDVGRVVTGLWDQMEKSVASANVQAAANSRLVSALQATGQYSDAVAQSLFDQATALQGQIVVGDEVILQQQAMALTLGANVDQLDEMSIAAAGAAAIGLNQTTVMRGLAQSLDGNVNMLGRYLPALRNMTEEQLRNGGAIDFMAERFGSLADNEAKRFEGRIKIITDLVGDSREAVGGWVTSSKMLNSALDIAADKMREVNGELAAQSYSLTIVDRAVLHAGQVLAPLVLGLGYTKAAYLGARSASDWFIANIETLGAVIVDVGVGGLWAMSKGMELLGFGTQDTTALLGDLIKQANTIASESRQSSKDNKQAALDAISDAQAQAASMRNLRDEIVANAETIEVTSIPAIQQEIDATRANIAALQEARDEWAAAAQSQDGAGVSAGDLADTLQMLDAEIASQTGKLQELQQGMNGNDGVGAASEKMASRVTGSIDRMTLTFAELGTQTAADVQSAADAMGNLVVSLQGEAFAAGMAQFDGLINSGSIAKMTLEELSGVVNGLPIETLTQFRDRYAETLLSIIEGTPGAEDAMCGLVQEMTNAAEAAEQMAQKNSQTTSLISGMTSQIMDATMSGLIDLFSQGITAMQAYEDANMTASEKIRAAWATTMQSLVSDILSRLSTILLAKAAEAMAGVIAGESSKGIVGMVAGLAAGGIVFGIISSLISKVPGAAEGGMVTGPGPRGKDSVLMMTAPGELILDTELTNALRSAFARPAGGSGMQPSGPLPRAQAGGVVDARGQQGMRGEVHVHLESSMPTTTSATRRYIERDIIAALKDVERSSSGYR